LGVGDGGLGIGYWPQSPIPNPQSPIPNPQSPYYIIFYNIYKIINFQIIILKLKNKYKTKLNLN